ncbi:MULTISPECIES: hypothetical protein [Methylobacterium]|jgi:hypothetical protein|uniref:Cyclic nucleotide-binding protein n=1 Tax=Methylobacterium fujisawaense TaxID=107400 RepID=A0ABR6DBN0_9HYPH|nr:MULTISPECIES: hypothetical protein [Methylobacterium]MBA9063485.1 hypothetical protein [Methylobacterium fujisawaense]RUP14036.1 MAG: hypothetical protein EKK43_13830 [Methylobacterium sp.]SFU33133.1 hypothetical protein SAMN02799643_00275 [Methylobacterium sp. UNCCL125]
MEGLLAPLFASGRIVDGILLLVAGEALVLAWLVRRRGGPPLPSLLANLASGAALMLALRAALVGDGWIAVAAWMLAGLVAHLADLGLRFRTATAQRRSPAPAGTTPRTAAFTRGTRI